MPLQAVWIQAAKGKNCLPDGFPVSARWSLTLSPPLPLLPQLSSSENLGLSSHHATPCHSTAAGAPRTVPSPVAVQPHPKSTRRNVEIVFGEHLTRTAQRASGLGLDQRGHQLHWFAPLRLLVAHLCLVPGGVVRALEVCGLLRKGADPVAAGWCLGSSRP